ncbi:MAG TPA: sigma-70 family RNA polymerase sigma factor [Myxococcales bacterium]|nr:sigma-70 family RNA polymerase sigma factor [Myxococcales bacterium]
MTRQSLFHDWLTAHRGILVKVARSFARSPGEAMDLRQEMLLQLWLALPRFAGDSQASTFIYRVCLNTALSWKRGAARREDRTADADLAQLSAEAVSPADDADRRQLINLLYAAIHQMAEVDRALVLLQLDGLSYREIAEITGMTENHVGVVLTRARKKLSALMKGAVDEVD